MLQHGPHSSLRQTPLAMVSRTNGETMARLGATLHLAVDTDTGHILAHTLTL